MRRSWQNCIELEEMCPNNEGSSVKIVLISSCVKYSDLACVNFEIWKLSCFVSEVGYYISFYHLLWVVPFSQNSSHHPVFIIHNFQDPNLQLHPGKDTQPLHITNVTVHRGPTEILRFFTEVQELFKQLGEADLNNWKFFCWYKKCVLWCFCVFFFLGGGRS